MTLNDIQRAELALFSARAAGENASLEQMKGIAYCMRNRVKQGWYEGQWLRVMEYADRAGGNLPGARVFLEPNSRTLQRFFSDVDEIFYRSSVECAGIHGERKSNKTPTAQSFAPEGGSLEETLGDCCYWARLDQPFTSWFQEHIMDHPNEHPMRAQMGLMAFFE